MEVRRLSSRARLSALAAIGVGLPLAILLAVGLSSGGPGSQDCEPERVQPGPGEVAAVAAGPHPLPWRLYARPVEAERLRHNRSHGGVVVQYGARVRAAVVAELTAWYGDDPVGLVVAPLPELGDAVLASAWAGRLSCGRFDRQRFAEFRDEHRFRGPERVAAAELRPVAAVEVAPQPVDGPTTLTFALPVQGRVEVEVRDRSGRTVRRLGSFTGTAGQTLVLRWDGRDGRGRRLAPGRYDVLLRVDGTTASSTAFRVRRPR